MLSFVAIVAAAIFFLVGLLCFTLHGYYSRRFKKLGTQIGSDYLLMLGLAYLIMAGIALISIK